MFRKSKKIKGAYKIVCSGLTNTINGVEEIMDEDIKSKVVDEGMII